MLNVNNLSKKYGKRIVVEDVTMHVSPGEITLLLGPNGAGKSTTLKSIAGLLNFEGDISICDYPNKSLEAKRLFGYVPETPALYELLTIEEHVTFIEKAYRLGKSSCDLAAKVIETFELSEHVKKPCRELSKGMQQKVGICLALMISPKVLMLDEPMLGLDPKAIKNLIETLQALKKDKIAILISTHIIDIVDDIWDKAYIMNHGRIAASLSREDTHQNGKSLKDVFFEITEGGNQ